MSLLKAVRERLGWSQLRMARELDCTQTYVCSVEKGRSALSGRLHAKLHIVAAAYGVHGVLADAAATNLRPSDREVVDAKMMDQLADLRLQLEYAQIQLSILNGRLRLQQRELDNYKQKG